MSDNSAESGTGYILDEFSSDRNGKSIITLCCLGNEGYFEVEAANRRIVFFIDRGAELPSLKGMERHPVELVNFDGGLLDGLYFSSHSEFYEGRKRLEEGGIRMYESDVQPDDRFLMEHFLFRGLEVEGRWRNNGRIKSCVPDSLKPGNYTPEFRVLSLDIETGQDGRLYSCGFHLTGRGGEDKTVFILDPEASYERTEECQVEDSCFSLVSFQKEKELLKASLDFIRESGADIIIGWHVIGFDLSFLEEKCRQFSVPFNIGRGGRRTRIIRKRSGFYSVQAQGRIVIDGPVSLRGGFHTFTDYRLETVARQILGMGKDIASDKDKVAEIEERFVSDKKALAGYNIMDCMLVSRIFEKTGLLTQFITRSQLTGLRLDRVNQSVAAFDFFMLPRFHRKGYAAPDVADINLSGHSAGGLVFTSDPGLYENIMVFDFLSLYPSIIRTFFIDPLARISASRFPAEPSVSTPMNISFSRNFHILPDHIGTLLSRRAIAKKEMDLPLSQAVKILMNSYYGVMGTPGCRFYHPDLPTAITGTGQWILRTSADYLRSSGYRVIYGDTDSLFVQIPGNSESEIHTMGDKLTVRINEYLGIRIKEEFGTESKLELEKEKLYSRFFLPPMRGSSEGSRKRYAGMLADTGEIEIKGMEFVRSDWTDLAKGFQMELFKRFFRNQELIPWIKTFVEGVRCGEKDDQLIYRRRLTKPASEYVKNIPPHVRAALLLDPEGKKRVRRIEYLMTLRGPVPFLHEHDDIDYNHYIEKQIGPLADAVLGFSGTSFNEILGGIQHELFN